VVVAGGTGQVAPFTTTRVAGLDLATGNGLMDVTSGALTISSGLTAPQLVAELIEGRANGSWTGTSGITSSTAAAEVAASTKRAVGWLDNGDGSLTVAYAAPGDTNLDWSIDILDVANFLALGKFDTGAASSTFDTSMLAVALPISTRRCSPVAVVTTAARLTAAVAIANSRVTV
jgi:hypothetical protein